MFEDFRVNKGNTKKINDDTYEYTVQPSLHMDDIYISLPKDSNLILKLSGRKNQFDFEVKKRVKSITIIGTMEISDELIIRGVDNIQSLTFQDFIKDTNISITGFDLDVLKINSPINILDMRLLDSIKLLIHNENINYIVGNLQNITSISGQKRITHLINQSDKVVNISPQSKVTNYYGNKRHSPNSYIFGQHCVNGDTYVNLDELLELELDEDRNKELVSYIL